MQADRGDPYDLTLIALNGLRSSEALNANIDAFSTKRGRRTLAVVRKSLIVERAAAAAHNPEQPAPEVTDFARLVAPSNPRHWQKGGAYGLAALRV